MLRRLSVRGKILATLAVPILVLVFAAVFISAQSLREVQVTRSISGALSALQVNRVFIDAVQSERAAGVLHAGEIRLERRLPFLDETERLTRKEEEARVLRAAERAEAFAQTQQATDATRVRAESQLLSMDFDTLDPLVRDAVERVLESRQRLGEVRASVESGNLAPNLIDRQYSILVSQEVGLIEQFAGTIDNRALGTYLNAYAIADATIDRITNERGFGFYAIETDGREASARDYLVALFPEANSVQSRARSAVISLGNPSIEMPDWGAKSEAFTDFMNLRSRLQVSTAQDWQALSENTWHEQATIEIEALRPTLSNLWTAVERNASASESRALSQATLTIIIALLAVAASVVVALLVGRTITAPLTRLTAAAGEVRDQLPRLVEQVATPGEGPDLTLMQIPVESADEIGRLATAFNEVNQTTVEVAQEQAALRGSIAEMFVNVARRDQVLLNRQLSFIDTLEREEEDPNTLANLFRLDHLATRMRRNAESLLVLAGIDSGRRVRGSMTLSDVIRTATSEIEQYERIDLQLGVDPHMHGFNSLPAAHLLAEILENATVFSEPGTMVDVVTSAEIEFITVTVIDRGLGMSDEDIKGANERIRATTASDVVGAQRLGLHVVGRLSARLGTKVVYARAEGEAGTEVRVRFPRALFVEDAQEAQPSSGGRVLTSAEVGDTAPAAIPVDLDALTDGQTGLGLPRRRASDAPEPAQPAGPMAPAGPPSPMAPAAQAPPMAPPGRSLEPTSSGLPSRRNIVLPEVATPQIAPDVAAAAAAGWSPQVEAPAAGGLPSRSRGASSGALPNPDAPVAPPRPAAAQLAPEQRSGMFAGFRRGGDVAPQADAAPVEAQRVEEPQEPAAPQFLIPELQPDEGRVAPEPAAAAEPVAFAPAEPEAFQAVPSLEPEPLPWSEVAGTPVQEQPAAVEPEAHETPSSWPSAASPEAPQDHYAATWQPDVPSAASPFAGQDDTAQQPAATHWGEPAPAAPASGAWDAGYAQSVPGLADEAAPPVWHESEPAAQTWGQAAPAWSPAEPEAPAPSAGSPFGAPAVEPQFPAFSPEAGYAPAAPTHDAPAWSAPAVPGLEPAPEPAPYEAPQEPAAGGWSPAAPTQNWGAPTPSWGAPAPEQPTAAPSWPGTGAAQFPPTHDAAPAGAFAPSTDHAAAAAPLAAAPVVGLPAFSDVVGQSGESPSRRSRRDDRSSSKPTRADRRAAKREAAQARAEAKAVAKAEARAKKKGEPSTPEPAAPSGALAPAAPGFFSQPTSIAALRSEGQSPAAPAPAPTTPVWAAPQEATPAPSAPQPAVNAWTAPPAAEPVAPAPAAQPAAFQAPPAAFQAQPAPEQPFTPQFQPPAPSPEVTAAPAQTSFAPGAAPAAWTPEGGGAPGGGRQFGVLDDEVAAMLALRSDIQEQALSELSQLSAYRPKVVQPAASLTRRTPTAIPSAPEMAEASGAPQERDPEALRSRLSSFQSGASRGRRVVPPTNSASSLDGAAPQANGSAEHAGPEVPPSNSTQEDQTW